MTGFDYAQIPAGYYDAVFHRGKGVQSKWHHLKFAKIRSAIQDFPRHLDIGCGPGTFIGTLDDTHDSTGIDIAPQQITYAQNHYASHRKTFTCATPSSFPAQSFDAITLIELIEHLPHGQNLQLIKDAAHLLRPGGRIVISTPNYASLWPALETILNRKGPISYAAQHITRYTPATLKTLLEQAGLRNIHVSSYLFAAPFAACLNWRAPHWLAKLEPECLTARWGFLLIATASA